MKGRVAWVLCMLSALLLAACASASSGGDSTRERDVISESEIRELPVTNAWELVSRLRPQWLRSRGPASVRSSGPAYPMVYVDEVRSGGPEALQRLSTMQITEIRFLSGRDASTRFGLDHGAGAILVSSRRGGGGGGDQVSAESRQFEDSLGR